MFRSDNEKEVTSDLYTIHSNYETLLFDEYPVLFVGMNLIGTKIVGSLIEEDEETDQVIFFHLLISDKDYSSFINHKISYRDLILKQENIYVVYKDVNNVPLHGYSIPVADIDHEYLPFEGVLCPNIEKVKGTIFSLSLKGMLADIHAAIPSVVSDISKATNQFLNTVTNALGLKNYHPQVLQIPYAEGSFKINFSIKLPEVNSLFYDPAVVSNFVSNLVEYSVGDLAKDLQPFIEKGTITDNLNSQIIEPYKLVLESQSMQFTEEKQKELLDNLKKIPGDIEKITETLGDGYEYIDVYVGNGINEGLLGQVDQALAKDINDVLSVIDPADPVEEDDVYKTYKIHIYKLNTTSRKGNAQIDNFASEDIIDKPGFFIEGNKNLEETIFTESLHLNKWIQVQAKAKKSKDKYRYLTIRF